MTFHNSELMGYVAGVWQIFDARIAGLREALKLTPANNGNAMRLIRIRIAQLNPQSPDSGGGK